MPETLSDKLLSRMTLGPTRRQPKTVAYPASVDPLVAAERRVAWLLRSDRGARLHAATEVLEAMDAGGERRLVICPGSVETRIEGRARVECGTFVLTDERLVFVGTPREPSGVRYIPLRAINAVVVTGGTSRLKRVSTIGLLTDEGDLRCQMRPDDAASMLSLIRYLIAIGDAAV